MKSRADRKMHVRGMWPVMVVLLLASGCGKSVERSDAEERMMPLVMKAEKKCLSGEFDAAVKLYEQALMEHPGAARVHLDLALVQHDHTKDLIAAVYHYRRYISLRPQSEKSAMIDDRIRVAQQQLKARGIGLEEKAMARLEELNRENAALRLEAEKLRAELTRVKQQLASQSVTRVAPPVQGRRLPGARPKTYRVKRGDSLGSIARDLYGDGSKWRDIYEANKTDIPDYDRVPVGLVLTIP